MSKGTSVIVWVCLTDDCDSTYEVTLDSPQGNFNGKSGKLWQHIKLLTLHISRSESQWLTRIDNAARCVIPDYMSVRMLRG